MKPESERETTGPGGLMHTSHRRSRDAVATPKKGLLAVMFVLSVLLLVDSACACPKCKDNLNGDSATAFAASILFMMSMPFAIFGGWIVTILRLRRRLRSGG